MIHGLLWTGLVFTHSKVNIKNEQWRQSNRRAQVDYLMLVMLKENFKWSYRETDQQHDHVDEQYYPIFYLL